MTARRRRSFAKDQLGLVWVVAVVELVTPEAGRYPAVSHVMVDAERGAHGLIRVTA